MSNSATGYVDRVMTSTMEAVYNKMYQHCLEGYCMPDDVYEALLHDWGEGTAEGWMEWVRADD